jgi:hypothetical protein
MNDDTSKSRTKAKAGSSWLAFLFPRELISGVGRGKGGSKIT